LQPASRTPTPDHPWLSQTLPGAGDDMANGPRRRYQAVQAPSRQFRRQRLGSVVLPQHRRRFEQIRIRGRELGPDRGLLRTQPVGSDRHPRDRHRERSAYASERSERATATARAGEAATKWLCRGVGGAKPLGNPTPSRIDDLDAAALSRPRCLLCVRFKACTRCENRMASRSRRCRFPAQSAMLSTPGPAGSRPLNSVTARAPSRKPPPVPPRISPAPNASHVHFDGWSRAS
jgi:hypothetical protein